MGQYIAEGAQERADYETRPRISRPQDVTDLMRSDLVDLVQEQIWILSLNTKNVVVNRTMLYQGTINSCGFRCGEVFRPAIVANACSIIVVHNHPSGDPTPSPEDVAVTRTVRDAGKLLDIELLDHVVIGRLGTVSLKERGLGF